MGTLLLDRAQLELRSDKDALMLYENGERRGTVPISLLDRVVIQGGKTRLDSGVLLHLAEAGVATLLLSPRMSRRVAIILGPAHNDAALRLAQARRVTDPSFCAAWARDLIAAKLRRQRRLLRTALEQRPDARKPLLDCDAQLAAALAHCAHLQADATASLLGIEGSAARAWFQALAALLPPSAGFAGRNRRPPRDPANACLSLAYTLLHFDAVRAAHIAGLDPLLGFYHRPAFGRESLAADLIEPLRPHADQWVWRLFATREIEPDHFTTERGGCLLGKAGRGRFYAAWEKAAPPARRWLRLAAMRLARALRTEGEALIAPADDGDDSW